MTPVRLGPSEPRLAPMIATPPNRWLGGAMSLAAHGVAAGVLAWAWTTTVPAETPAIAIEMVVVPPAPIVADAVPMPVSAPSLASESPPPEPAPAATEAPPEVLPPPVSEPSPPTVEADASPPPEPTATGVTPPREPPSVAPASVPPPRPKATPPSRRVPVTAVQATIDAPAAAPSVVASAPVAHAPPAVAPAPAAPANNAGDVYLGRLVAWLSRHKEYPRAARETGIEGEVLVRFRIERDGTVVERSIQRSSGHGVLDRAVIRLLERASPMPAPPESLARLEFAVPIRYGLE